MRCGSRMRLVFQFQPGRPTSEPKQVPLRYCKLHRPQRLLCHGPRHLRAIQRLRRKIPAAMGRSRRQVPQRDEQSRKPDTEATMAFLAWDLICSSLLHTGSLAYCNLSKSFVISVPETVFACEKGTVERTSLSPLARISCVRTRGSNSSTALLHITQIRVWRELEFLM